MIRDLFTWWLVIQAFGLVGLPLTTFLFRALPDRGYAAGKSMGLLLVCYGAWLLAMFGLGSFGSPLLLIVALLVGAGGAFLMVRRAGSLSALSPLPYLRQHWHAVLFSEAVFLAFFLLAVWIRGQFPDPWGTERPMDYAFFNAFQRSSVFPPQDPWLAGYSINYYYVGYLMMAAVALLSRLEPSVAFNLSVSLIFALTAQNVAGLICNLVVLAEQHEEETNPEPAPPAPRPWRVGMRYLAALLGVLLVLMAGNQAGALQVITGDYRVVALDGRQLLSAVGQALGGAEEITLPYPVRTGDFGTFSKLKQDDTLDNFNWWWPSRALWDDVPPEQAEQPDSSGQPMRIYNITEFPFFSFWLGDMHPHVMALPFGLLAMTLALAMLARPDAPAFTVGRQGWLDLVLSAIILGSLYTINSWDMPTYALLSAGVLLLLAYRQADHPDAIAWKSLFGKIMLLIIAMWLLFAPFYLTFHSLVGSAKPLTSIPLLAKFTQIVAPYHGSRSGLLAFLTISGLFAIPLLVFTYAVGDRLKGAVASGNPWVVLPWLGPVLLIVGVLVGFPLLSLVGFGMLAFYRALHHAERPASAFLLLLVALGCAICVGTDLMYIRDVFSTRMNTIFKFYYQVWLLWGVAAAYVVWWLLMWGTQGRRQRLLVMVPTLAVVVVLLAGASVYPAINLRDRWKVTRPMHLTGKTPREDSDAGAESIRWLREHAEPDSIVLEAVAPGGGSYNPEGYAGVSAATGIPTVLGWSGHESQWRGGHPSALAELAPRQSDVTTIYSTTDVEEARALLQKYNVTYVYVGMLERQQFDASSLAKFDTIGQVVFQSGEVTIYQVESP